MEQFSLEKYLDNQSRKITTRLGNREVRIICWNRKNNSNRPIITLMIDPDGNEYTTFHTKNGFVDEKEKYLDKRDLFFADEEEESQSTEFSFGAFDSEFVRDEYLIPEGCEARIEGNKVIIEKIKEPVSEDLEEAARHYLLNTHTSPLNNILHQADLKVEMQYHKDIEDAYKAGAEEYKQHMKEAFQTEYEKGRFDMQQEMMKDAVEGVVHHFPHDELAAVHYNDPKGTPMSIYVSSKGLSAGDRVKIIIVKEKEEK